MGTVRATGLVKMFGTVAAVNDLSFEAKAGEFLTLLGPSGCGKTTTLRLVAGLERPDRGEIQVGDRPLSSATSGLFVPPERRGMGMVFQSYAIWPHMTVFENVDARLREEMRFELREMQAKLGITSIFVTHDQAEAMTLSDRIVVMNAGRIEQEGSPEEVYQRPSSRFVMDFLGRANHLPARIRRGDDGSLVAEVEESGFCMPVGGLGTWQLGQEVLLAFRPEAVQAQAADRDGAWVGLVRSSVYVSGHVEYVVEIGKFTVRATGPEDARLPHDARAKLCVSPRAVRVWPRGAGANGGTA